jgi:phage baseplate assembly protein W
MSQKFFGYNFPFLSDSFVLPPQEDVRLIKNDLKQLLLTSPGERVMRPDYGTPIRKYAFEQLDQQSIDELRSGIRQAILRFEPRVKPADVLVIGKPDHNLVEITVLGKIIATQQPIDVTLTIPGTVIETSARSNRRGSL